MMKRTAMLVLVLMYSLSAIGMPLHYHYCKGQLQHVTILAKKDCGDHQSEQITPFACCLGKQTPHCDSGVASIPCCDDRSDWLASDDSPVVAGPSAPEVHEGYTASVCVVSNALVELHAEQLSATAHAPPGKEKPYLLYCALIVYG